MSSKLYQPLKIGATTIANRIVMAPLTRCRSDNATHMPNELMAEYYAQRASAGLIIAECTMILPKTSAFYNEPGIYNDEQVEGWKKVTGAVHAAGGKIFLQIWHGGRACPAEYNGGQQPVAPSAVAIGHRYNSAIQNTLVPNDVPRPLTDDEAQEIVKAFGEAAKRSIAAGFDGIEIHGANGYLVSQFLTTHGNQRGPESRYSGATFETRARFALEVVDACCSAIGADKVGIRLSPYVLYNNAAWENPASEASYIAKELDKRGIAYIHVERRDMFTPGRDQTVDVTSIFRENFTHQNGCILSNVDFEREEAESYADSGKADAIVFGVPLLANPDLVRRFVEKLPERNVPDMSTFYTPGFKGYTDYPALA